MSSCFSDSVLLYYVLCDFSIKSVKTEIKTQQNMIETTVVTVGCLEL